MSSLQTAVLEHDSSPVSVKRGEGEEVRERDWLGYTSGLR